MKAFLSHSSHDKEFVSAVAKELGRQFAVFDTYSFQSGVEFKKSIEDGLDQSSVFTLFVSHDALESVWVEFESDEAWHRKLVGQISRALVILIDASIDQGVLPPWLRRAKFLTTISPGAAAREVRGHLDELRRAQQQPYFVNRTDPIEEIQRKLMPVDGSAAPRAIFITGLPSIGRRSVAAEAARRLLNLRRPALIRVESGDSANDIALKLADRSAPYSTDEGLKRLASSVSSLPTNKAVQRCLDELRGIAAGGEIPILFDDGGVLDEHGNLADPVRMILSQLTPTDEAYIFIVSNRRPQDPGLDFPVVSVNPLKTEDTQRLISTIATNIPYKLSQSQVVELADYVLGFPPSAYHAVELASEYGIDLVLADKTKLVEFRATTFVRYIRRLKLTDQQEAILRLLEAHHPLPLEVIGKTIGLDPEPLSEAMTDLIDHSMVVLDDRYFYDLADPIREAVAREMGLVSNETTARVVDNLNGFLKDQTTEVGILDVSRALYRAAALIGQELSDDVTHIATDVIRLTAQAYHQRDYPKAIVFGRAAIGLRPNNTDSREWLIRALVQEEHFSEAEAEIEKLRNNAPLRRVYFITGFLRRRQHRLREAIASYQEAERLGQGGQALKRELAFCYFLNDDLDSAQEAIRGPADSDPDNRFVVDLSIQIATRRHDEDPARRGLARLEILDAPEFFHHRRSMVELAFGQLDLALEAAQTAVQSRESPLFAHMAQLAKCQIRKHLPEPAKDTLGRLRTAYPRIRRNVRIGLECRLAILEERFSDALTLWEEITEKQNPIHKAIRKDAIEGLLRTTALKDEQRIAFETELTRLRKDLEKVSEPDLDIQVD